MSRDPGFALGVTGGGPATPKVPIDDNQPEDRAHGWAELVRYFEVFQLAGAMLERPVQV